MNLFRIVMVLRDRLNEDTSELRNMSIRLADTNPCENLEMNFIVVSKLHDDVGVTEMKYKYYTVSGSFMKGYWRMDSYKQLEFYSDVHNKFLMMLELQK